MTILFYKDWEEQDALPDWDTKNRSFVDLAGLYQQMGVKNYAMILALHDQELKGVDPYSKELTKEQKIAITVECKNNVWYWFREIARDPSGSAEYPLPFKANRGIISAVWLYMCHVLIFLIMIRQTGKSFGIDWLLMWLANVALTKTEISVLTKDDKLRSRQVERIKGMELTVPDYIKRRSARDPGNTEVIKIGSLGNLIRLNVPNRSPKIADMIGRGMTSPTVVVDEINYCPNNDITIPVMLSATQAAREVSRMKDEPYGTIFMSTSGKRDTDEGRYGYKLMSGAAVWDESLFNSENLEELHTRVIKASPDEELHVNCTFNHRQLGQTDEWLRARIKESVQKDPTAIAADYFNEWPSGTMSSPFSQEEAEVMRGSEDLNFIQEFTVPEEYSLRWYYPEDGRKHRMMDPHILSVDPSELVSSDAIGMTLRNALTGEVAMAADVSEGNLIAYCRWLASFLMQWNSVTLIVERKNTGAMILDYLLDYLPTLGIDPFRRVFNQVVQLAEEYPERYKEIQNPFGGRENMFVKYKKYFGWSTSATGATARGDLFGRTLTEAARMTGSMMKDRKLILQTLGLIVKNGRLDHASDKHDDILVSWLLSFWLLKLGKNLHHYGIDSSLIFSRNPVYQIDLKNVSLYDQSVMNEAREEVQRLSMLLKDETDDFLATRLEYDLERALKRLSKQDKEVIASDDLINKLREERARSSRRRAAATYGNDSDDYGYGYGGYY